MILPWYDLSWVVGIFMTSVGALGASIYPTIPTLKYICMHHMLGNCMVQPPGLKQTHNVTPIKVHLICCLKNL